mmetsp:Transcript_10703/g.29324  ORF Transcript_10703/g.29324 Transcript_10703/m.29324 type:complete len:219 (-) Transcript_10703:32-688(-)
MGRGKGRSGGWGGARGGKRKRIWPGSAGAVGNGGVQGGGGIASAGQTVAFQALRAYAILTGPGLLVRIAQVSIWKSQGWLLVPCRADDGRKGGGPWSTALQPLPAACVQSGPTANANGCPCTLCCTCSLWPGFRERRDVLLQEGTERLAILQTPLWWGLQLVLPRHLTQAERAAEVNHPILHLWGCPGCRDGPQKRSHQVRLQLWPSSSPSQAEQQNP